MSEVAYALLGMMVGFAVTSIMSGLLNFHQKLDRLQYAVDGLYGREYEDEEDDDEEEEEDENDDEDSDSDNEMLDSDVESSDSEGSVDSGESGDSEDSEDSDIESEDDSKCKELVCACDGKCITVLECPCIILSNCALVNQGASLVEKPIPMTPADQVDSNAASASIAVTEMPSAQATTAGAQQS